MCYKKIDKYACDDKDEVFIPCEGFTELGNCSQPESEKQDQVVQHAEKCPECLHFDEQMKKLAEDPELSKPMPKTASQPYDGPKLYFIECNKWKHCGHISDPKETNIERDPEEKVPYLEISQIGSCWKCSEATSAQIEEMKQNGSYYGLDPWNAMKGEVAAAAGSSAAGATSLDAGTAAASELEKPDVPTIPIDEVEEMEDDMAGMSMEDKARQVGAATGAPISDGESRSSSPTPGKKGKGRVGKPEDEYAERYGAAAEPQEDSDLSGAEDESPRGRRGSSMVANVHERDHSSPPTEDHETTEAPPSTGGAADGDFIVIGPEEHAKYRLPLGAKLPKSVIARKEQEAQDGMTQFKSGALDEEVKRS